MQNVQARKVLNLDGNWHYIADPYNTGDDHFFANKQQETPDQLLEYDFEKSPTLTVPGDWNSQQQSLLFYEGVVWYQKDFVFHPKPGKKYFLQFDAVNYKAEVYINGKQLGLHTGGFTPFSFEITDQLNDGNNFIVVKTDNTRKKENVPTENFDWWNYGGITRDVTIAETPETYISDYNLQLTKPDRKNIMGYVQLEGEELSQQVTVQILEANLQIKISTNDKGRASFVFPIKNINLWTPEHPQLYTIVIQTKTDTTTDRMGFRTIETNKKDILLNGKPIFLRGICLHEEDPDIPGRPRNIDEYRMLLNRAKELNCNFIRLAHYPHNEIVSRLADEMGILLWEEIPVYWNIDWENVSAYESAKQQLTELITRDKARASVIIWSIGNETPATDTRERFMENLADLAHRLDTTRLVSAALLGGFDSANVFHLNDPLANKLDITSFNEYVGWYNASPNEIHNFSFALPNDKPVVITEFGGGALGGFHADSATRFSEEFQEKIYTEQLKILSKIDALRGITPWILNDFRSPKRLNPTYQDYWNRKGLISATGQKKKAYYVLKAYYDAVEKKYRNN